MPEIRVQDEQGTTHVFPDGSTPEMIAKVMGVKVHPSLTMQSMSPAGMANQELAKSGISVGPMPGVPQVQMQQPGAVNRFFTAAGAALTPEHPFSVPDPGDQMVEYQKTGKVTPQVPFGSGEAITSPIKRGATGDIAGGLGEFAPTAIQALLGARAGSKAVTADAVANPGPVPTPPETTIVNKLYAASGASPKLKMTPQLIEDLQTAAPIVRQGAGAASSVPEASGFFENASRQIQQKLGPLVEQNSSADVSGEMKAIADKIRSNVNPQLKTFSPATADEIGNFASKLENVKTLGDADNLRNLLSGENASLLKKSGLDHYTAIQDPEIGYKMRALEDVRQVIADKIEQVTGNPEIRTLRRQQSALIRLSDVFDKQSGVLDAQSRIDAAQPARVRAGQAIGSVTQFVTSPKQAAVSAMTRPKMADALVKQAFKKR